MSGPGVLPSQVVRMSYGRGRYRGDGDTGEADYVFGTYGTWSGARTQAALWCHGDGGTANASSFQMLNFWKGLALDYTLMTADLAGTHGFGNDAQMDAMDDAVDYLVASWSAVEPVFLIGASMGATTALNWAKRNPTRVRAVACVIPATDIDYMHTNSAAPVPADIDASYAGGWSQATYGADHNPITFAASMDAALPIKLWYAPDDTFIPTAMPLAFQAARPQTEVELLPAGGHTDASILNSLTSMRTWLAAH
jgi:pimeloyl-ACP methyl ester carboxylesterase